MYRKVIVWPQRALYKESRSVELKEPDFTKLDDLVDTFRVIQGYGLAAPQIGHQIRAFVINHHALNIDGYDGEYIEYEEKTMDDGRKIASDVTGVYEQELMCENVYKKNQNNKNIQGLYAQEKIYLRINYLYFTIFLKRERAIIFQKVITFCLA